MAATIIEKKDLHTPNNGPVKGRRKLDFSESQRFKGKHFFLDLDGYRKANQIAAELTNRGAVSDRTHRILSSSLCVCGSVAITAINIITISSMSDWVSV